ncbi:MAG: CHASE2 domain-containing protein [Elainellaceae cyanobacterium]
MNLRFPKLKRTLARLGWSVLPGAIAAGFVGASLSLGVWRPLEQIAYNLAFQIRGAYSWDDRVVIIEIDEATLETLGAFPLDRRYYAQLITRLAQEKSNILVMGIVLAEPSSSDSQLATAIGHHGRVVLAQAWDNEGQPILPNPQLEQVALNLGHVLNRPSTDGVTRAIAPEIQGVPALGLAATQSYALIQEPVPFPNFQSPLWINWAGPIEQIPHYSMLSVLNGDIPAHNFQNKIVIFGVAVAGLAPISTPYNREPPANGIHLHAAVINNVLQRNFLQVPSISWIVIILLLGGPGLSIAFANRGLKRLWVAWLVLCLSWMVVVLVTFKLNYWFPAVWPVALITLGAGTTDIGERLRANARLQNDIETLWQMYHYDLVLGSTSTDPDREYPGAAQQLMMGNQHPLQAVERFQPIAMQRVQQLAQLAEQFGRSQSAHAAIARSLSVGIVAADWDGRVWFCNPVAADLIPIQVGDRLQSGFIPRWVKQPDWHAHLRKLQGVQATHWETQLGEQWFDVRLEPLVYHPALARYDHRQSEVGLESPRGMLLMIEDITPYKQVEIEIRKALEQEREFGELNSRFVSMVSHEIRTPLTVLRTSIELLEHYGHRADELRKKAYFHQIRGAIATMAQLMEDVLIVSKAEAGKLELNLVSLDTAAFCRDIVDEIQMSVGSGRNVILTCQHPPDMLTCDRNILRLILVNLLSNAVKYSPPDAPVHFEVASDGHSIEFHIRDEGIGIPTDEQHQVFDEFHRARNVGSTPGTGLGLSIVRHCVRLHDGTISLTSKPGVGTTFTVKIPQAGDRPLTVAC